MKDDNQTKVFAKIVNAFMEDFPNIKETANPLNKDEALLSLSNYAASFSLLNKQPYSSFLKIAYHWILSDEFHRASEILEELKGKLQDECIPYLSKKSPN